MRSSILSRSVIAVASLAIGSVALAGAPAMAAAPAGVTRDAVLTDAASIRAEGNELSDATIASLKSIAAATCATTSTETVVDVRATATAAGDDADGFVVKSVITGTGGALRLCDFGAVAVVDAAFTLTGTSSITGQMTTTPAPGSGTPLTLTAPLSGQVAVTAPINGTLAGGFSIDTTFSANGNAARTTSVKKTIKVKDKKTKKQKKAAKKKYEKRLKAAKKKYAKALDKAGSSKSKKAAAKKSYSKARASAKARYKYAIANYKLVKKTVPVTENRPFSVTAERTGLGFA